MPRIIGLTMLDRLGVTWFQHLPGMNHMGLITRPEAVAAIVATPQATPDR